MSQIKLRLTSKCYAKRARIDVDLNSKSDNIEIEFFFGCKNNFFFQLIPQIFAILNYFFHFSINSSKFFKNIFLSLLGKNIFELSQQIILILLSIDFIFTSHKLILYTRIN